MGKRKKKTHTHTQQKNEELYLSFVRLDSISFSIRMAFSSSNILYHVRSTYRELVPLHSFTVVVYKWLLYDFENLCHRMFWMNEWMSVERKTNSATRPFVYSSSREMRLKDGASEKICELFGLTKKKMKWDETEMKWCECVWSKRNAKWWRLWSLLLGDSFVCVFVRVCDFIFMDADDLRVPISFFFASPISHSIHRNQFIYFFSFTVVNIIYLFFCSVRVSISHCPSFDCAA